MSSDPDDDEFPLGPSSAEGRVPSEPTDGEKGSRVQVDSRFDAARESSVQPQPQPPPNDSSDVLEVSFPDEDGPRVSRMRVGDEDIVVLSVPLPKLHYPEGTTSAEQEIIDMVLQGKTAAEIAQVRGASLRTVTTQLSTIFRKANVNSQAELIAMMTGD